MPKPVFSKRLNGVDDSQRREVISELLAAVEYETQERISLMIYIFKIVANMPLNDVNAFLDAIAHRRGIDAMFYLYKTLNEGDTTYLQMLFPFVKDAFATDYSGLVNDISKLLQNASINIRNNPDEAQQAIEQAQQGLSGITKTEFDNTSEDIFI